MFAGQRTLVIGMVHLLPLPGAGNHTGDSLDSVRDRALAEAHALQHGGVDAILIQNSGDLAPAREGGPETIACMSVIGTALRREVPCPLGVNVLAHGAVSAIAIAQAIGASFVRIKVHIGAVITTEGVVSGRPHKVLAFRRRLGAEQIDIAADVYDRTSAPLGEMPLEVAADLAHRLGGASALIVTGHSVEQSVSRLRQVKAAVPGAAVLAGGGTTAANVGLFLAVCDGVIVGSSIKDTGQFVGRVDPARLAQFMEAVDQARHRPVS